MIRKHTCATAYVLTSWQAAMRIKPTVAKSIMAANPWGRPQASIILEMGNFRTPLNIEETSIIVGIKECEENSLVT